MNFFFPLQISSSCCVLLSPLCKSIIHPPFVLPSPSLLPPLRSQSLHPSPSADGSRTYFLATSAAALGITVYCFAAGVDPPKPAQGAGCAANDFGPYHAENASPEGAEASEQMRKSIVSRWPPPFFSPPERHGIRTWFLQPPPLGLCYRGWFPGTPTPVLPLPCLPRSIPGSLGETSSPQHSASLPLFFPQSFAQCAFPCDLRWGRNDPYSPSSECSLAFCAASPCLMGKH